MWDQLTTFWSLDRAEKHYSLKEQPLNMPLGSQNPYAKRAYCVWVAWRLVLSQSVREAWRRDTSVCLCDIAGDFMKPDQVIYDDIVKFQELKRFMEEQLEDYNMEPGIIAMDLVLFRDAIDHGKGYDDWHPFML